MVHLKGSVLINKVILSSSSSSSFSYEIYIIFFLDYSLNQKWDVHLHATAKALSACAQPLEFALSGFNFTCPVVLGGIFCFLTIYCFWNWIYCRHNRSHIQTRSHSLLTLSYWKCFLLVFLEAEVSTASSMFIFWAGLCSMETGVAWEWLTVGEYVCVRVCVWR